MALLTAPLLFLFGLTMGCSNAPPRSRPEQRDRSDDPLRLPHLPRDPGRSGSRRQSWTVARRASAAFVSLAGVLPNTSANLEQWVMHPQKFQPGIAMPEMGVAPADARQ